MEIKIKNALLEQTITFDGNNKEVLVSFEPNGYKVTTQSESPFITDNVDYVELSEDLAYELNSFAERVSVILNRVLNGSGYRTNNGLDIDIIN